MHLSQPAKRLERADQDTSRMTRDVPHDIQALMHAVYEIDIGVSSRTEEYFGPLRFATGGMGSEIVQAEIGFSFNDHSGRFAMQQNATEQKRRKLNCRALEKLKIYWLGVANQPLKRPGVLSALYGSGLRFVTSRQCTLEH